MFRNLRFLIPILLVPHLLLAQDTTSLNLDNLITEALKSNPGIAAAKARWNSALQIPEQAGALEDPMLTYTRWISTPETRVGPQENVLMLSQKIPFPGKLGKKESMAREDAEVAGQTYGAIQRDLVLKVQTAYYDLYRIDASLGVVSDYLDLLRDFSSVAEEKYATGEGIQASVFKSQVEISRMLELQLDLLRSRAGIAARMNALLNRPKEMPVAKANAIDTNLLVIVDSLVIRTALSKRQELLMGEAMVRKSGVMSDLARLEYFPNFSFQASYITIPNGVSKAVDSGKDPYSFSVGINIPLFFGRRSAAVEQADANMVASKMGYTNVVNNVEAEIVDLIAQVRSTGRTLDLYDKGLLVQASSSLESALSAYRTGKMDFLSLLDAERMLLQVRLGFIREQTTYKKLVAALERAAGGRLGQ